jgi:hypothetical protein
MGWKTEHRLARNLTFTPSYLVVRGIKLSRTRNINLTPSEPLFGPSRADPRFNDIFQLEDSASSTYQGVSFTLNRRMAEELEFSASYTLSKTTDNASAFDEQPQNPFDLGAEWAPSRQDQRQRLVFNALWELPIGDEQGAAPPQERGWLTRVFEHFEVAPILTVESGRPVDPVTGADNGTNAFPLSARPAGFGRNSLATPMLANLDLRLLKYFPFGQTAHLDLVAESFNLFNRANVGEINPIFGTGTAPHAGFQQPTAGVGARRVQFSLDFEY